MLAGSQRSTVRSEDLSPEACTGTSAASATMQSQWGQSQVRRHGSLVVERAEFLLPFASWVWMGKR